jgi:membrane protease YdiL (CAAX protease family)
MRSLLKFFLLTFIVSWAFFAAAASISGWTFSPTSGPAALSGALLFLGIIAPSLVALALTELIDGRAGTLALLRRVVEWRASIRWYVFAVGYMAVIKLTVVFLHRLATGAWPAFGQTAWYILAVAIIFSTPVQAGEEIGWRGYALPRLAKRYGVARASIALGVIWACWHLPFFLIPGADKSGQSFPIYLLSVTAISVAMAWLYWRADGSLLLTMLMHAAINHIIGIVPSPVSQGANPLALNASLVAWLTAALLWICAVYFLFSMRRATLRDGWKAV